MTDRHKAIGDVVAALMLGDSYPRWAPDQTDATAILVDYTQLKRSRSRAENDAAYMRDRGFSALAIDRDGKQMLQVVVGVCDKDGCFCREGHK